jgi:hypothetical protein
LLFGAFHHSAKHKQAPAQPPALARNSMLLLLLLCRAPTCCVDVQLLLFAVST